MAFTDKPARATCPRCKKRMPQYRSHRGQRCPRCVVDTVPPSSPRVEKARQTLKVLAAKADAHAAIPVKVIDPQDEERRQEAARVRRSPQEKPAPPARAVGNVRVF